MTRLPKSILSLLLCCLLLVTSFGTCSAYTITEEQLQTLETNSATRDQIIERLETSLAKSEKDLASAQQKVEEYQTASAKQQERLIALEIKLAIAEEKSKNLDNSLNQINESFKIYEKETKGKIRKLTFEKDLAILVAICFAAKG